MSKRSGAKSSIYAPLINALRANTPANTQAVNPLEGLLGYQLRRASQAMLDDLNGALEDFSLRPTSASILLLVAANPGITQSRIGQTLAIERANMAPMTARFAKRGLLPRAAADGRSHGLYLTEEGKRLVTKIRKRIDEHEEKFWAAAKPSDREGVLQLLKALWAQAT